MTHTPFVLPALPPSISRTQTLAALDTLGLPHGIRELTMDVYGITVTLLAQTADGDYVHVGDDAAYITVRLPIGQPDGAAQDTADPPELTHPAP